MCSSSSFQSLEHPCNRHRPRRVQFKTISHFNIVLYKRQSVPPRGLFHFFIPNELCKRFSFPSPCTRWYISPLTVSTLNSFPIQATTFHIVQIFQSPVISSLFRPQHETFIESKTRWPPPPKNYFTLILAGRISRARKVKYVVGINFVR